MIEDFLRPPRTVGEFAADAVRVGGLLSVVLAALLFAPTDAGVVAFTLPGLVLPRFLGVRAWLDIGIGLTLLVAAWSNVFDLYTRLVGWDLIIHFVCTAAAAILAVLLARRCGIVEEPRAPRLRRVNAVLLATTFGVTLSALWEMVEWVGHAFISDDIFVAYADTIGDLAAGGLGAVVAGFLIAGVPLTRQR